MATYRCPKHDVVFEANKPPNVHGHAKCPTCKKPEPAKREDVKPEAQAQPEADKQQQQPQS